MGGTSNETHGFRSNQKRVYYFFSYNSFSLIFIISCTGAWRVVALTGAGPGCRCSGVKASVCRLSSRDCVESETEKPTVLPVAQIM